MFTILLSTQAVNRGNRESRRCSRAICASVVPAHATLATNSVIVGGLSVIYRAGQSSADGLRSVGGGAASRNADAPCATSPRFQEHSPPAGRALRTHGMLSPADQMWVQRGVLAAERASRARGGWLHTRFRTDAQPTSASKAMHALGAIDTPTPQRRSWTRGTCPRSSISAARFGVSSPGQGPRARP